MLVPLLNDGSQYIHPNVLALSLNDDNDQPISPIIHSPTTWIKAIIDDTAATLPQYSIASTSLAEQKL